MIENIKILNMNYSKDVVNSILIQSLDTLLIIDTGISEKKEILLNEINKYNFRKLFVILTHAHPDHIGNNYALKENYNPIFITNLSSKKLLENYTYQFNIIIDKVSDHFKVKKEFKDFYFALLDKEVEIDVSFTEEMYLNLGTTDFKIIKLPGHTDGDIGIIDKKNRLLILSELIFKHSRNIMIYIDILCKC